MIVLDAYALLAAASGEPAGGEVGEILRGDSDCAIAAANLAEVYDHLVRRAELSPEEVDRHVGPLLDERLEVRELDTERAVRTGLLQARFYRKGSAELSLADCALLASLVTGDEVATADPPLAAAARELGYEVRGLPDSRGRRP